MLSLFFNHFHFCPILLIIIILSSRLFCFIHKNFILTIIVYIWQTVEFHSFLLPKSQDNAKQFLLTRLFDWAYYCIVYKCFILLNTHSPQFQTNSQRKILDDVSGCWWQSHLKLWRHLVGFRFSKSNVKLDKTLFLYLLWWVFIHFLQFSPSAFLFCVARLRIQYTVQMKLYKQ